ncbi:hypothetical protein PF005_g13966 [Phytophthora fragariae]|uniref:N-acetyltransferase domain-containing protein n=1 Tax=Phytophthora fragariae TaxID=53985 RepID=A0A6A3ERJ7_9STRA|nr:hypothetical protein PF003_g25388 [Phytophthora fragariae]KAE8934561.1 hypothetical protein PF009_g15464 [Phytophthora fragariae]KAE9003257.1 hypothetical protein PF011_g12970 [Phytophthora fragariae]KAE9103209.1 hypothetical protein PF007_g14490 [Phytophthora fragariae]KAE9103583.1 hypothetical protein PF010_g13679 [Phytophthora fragariae]
MTTDTQVQVTVRQYRPEDHAAVTKIFVESIIAVEKNLEYRYRWEERLREDLTTDLADIQASHMAPGGNFWVAVATTKGTSKVVGITGLMRVSESVGEVRRVYVDQTCHRMGVGRKLMAQMESWSRQNGIKSVFLTTNAKNESSQAFYAALGYTKADETLYAWENLKYFEVYKFVKQL